PKRVRTASRKGRSTPSRKVSRRRWRGKNRSRKRNSWLAPHPLADRRCRLHHPFRCTCPRWHDDFPRFNFSPAAAAGERGVRPSGRKQDMCKWVVVAAVAGFFLVLAGCGGRSGPTQVGPAPSWAKGTVDGVSCEVRGRGESSSLVGEGFHEFT